MNYNAYLPVSKKASSSLIKVPRIECKFVKTSRYLYHLSYNDNIKDECCLKRYSFIKYGIQGIEFGKRGVWANSELTRIGQMWPIPIDSFEWGFKRRYEDGYLEYDVWRIDTQKCLNKWLQDPIMDKEEASAYGIDYENYLFTLNTVPSSALRLYKFKPHRYFDENNKVSLVALNKVNELINHSIKKAFKETAL